MPQKENNINNANIPYNMVLFPFFAADSSPEFFIYCTIPQTKYTTARPVRSPRIGLISFKKLPISSPRFRGAAKITVGTKETAISHKVLNLINKCDLL